MRRSSLHLIGITRGKNTRSERGVIFEEIITKKFFGMDERYKFSNVKSISKSTNKNKSLLYV